MFSEPKRATACPTHVLAPRARVKWMPNTNLFNHRAYTQADEAQPLSGSWVNRFENTLMIRR